MRYDIPEHPQHPAYKLSKSSLIGRGNKRDCHVHPSDPRLCVKVARHLDKWDECQEQNIIEWHYMLALKQRQVPLDHLADCHGWVRTNYGPGLVFERILNEDGSPALTLRDAISAEKISMDQTTLMLRNLKLWTIHNSVVVADLNGANLMVKTCGQSGARLILVDGVGSRRADWKFTLYQKSLWLARIKTKRQWIRQEPQMYHVLLKRLAQRKAKTD